MQLLSSPASPFVRKVRVQLLESGLSDRVEEVVVTTSPYDTPADLAAANPVGKIPTLTRPDGPALFDSRVICRYLDQLNEGASLYPQARLWEVLTLEALCDGIMDASVSMTYEARFRPESQQSEEWTNAQWSRIERSLSALETRWMPLLSGPLHMGQIAAGCALGYLDLRHDARNWRAAHPALAEWFATFNARDSMTETAPV